MPSVPIIILAAGASRRLGSPKQLVPHGKSTLLRHITTEAIKSTSDQVYVITGAYPELAHEVSDLTCRVIHHQHWIEGMGSSIAYGVDQLGSNVFGVIISTSDQPYLSAKVFGRLDGSAPIMISQYREGAGPPSYFSDTYFDDLIALRDDQGAKSIVRRHIDKVRYIPFPQGDIDIDTREDVLHWSKDL